MFENPEIVCEIMKEEPRMLFRGRLTATFYTMAKEAAEQILAQYNTAPWPQRQIEPLAGEGSDVAFMVYIPGLRSPGYTVRIDMSSEGQADMFEDWASDEGYPDEIIAEGKRLIRVALKDRAS